MEKKDFDVVLDKLFNDSSMDKNTLFCFWDILSAMNGRSSCIGLHNDYARELKDKLDALCVNHAKVAVEDRK